MPNVNDNWSSASAYDIFMGRWSRKVALEFIGWLDPHPGLHWLDLGCGTGALTTAILERANPVSVLACDPSASLLDLARENIHDQRVEFKVAGAADLREPAHELNAFVSGLVLNFIGDPKSAVGSIARWIAQGGIVGAYVWDYSDGMEFLRLFWDAAKDLDPNAADLDEGKRFPISAPDPLQDLFKSVGLKDVEVAPLEVETRFDSFEDYWEPFLGATGPAPSYVKSIDFEMQQKLKKSLRSRLSKGAKDSFTLSARAWAVRGFV